MLAGTVLCVLNILFFIMCMGDNHTIIVSEKKTDAHARVCECEVYVYIYCDIYYVGVSVKYICSVCVCVCV